MDSRVVKACKKAIKLCNYMLKIQHDTFVRSGIIKINQLIIENTNQISASREAREISRYIKHNFDSALGQNIELEINQLINAAEAK